MLYMVYKDGEVRKVAIGDSYPLVSDSLMSFALLENAERRMAEEDQPA